MFKKLCDCHSRLDGSKIWRSNCLLQSVHLNLKILHDRPHHHLRSDFAVRLFIEISQLNRNVKLLLRFHRKREGSLDNKVASSVQDAWRALEVSRHGVNIILGEISEIHHICNAFNRKLCNSACLKVKLSRRTKESSRSGSIEGWMKDEHHF